MSKWLNNKTPLKVPYKKPKDKSEKAYNSFYKEFQENDHMKPCHYTGFCVYGQLVEEFPCHQTAEDFAIKMDKYVKLGKKGWVKCNKNDNGSQPDIEYGIRHTLDFRSCKVFGHECPVFYMAEPLAEPPGE